MSTQTSAYRYNPFMENREKLQLSHPFTLAALSGYSDLGMRMVCRELGASLTRHEVILDEFVVQKGKGARSGTHLHPADRPIVCQLMGKDPQMMGQAARQMAPLGYDSIDINFGCPVKKVLGRCRGGFLLSDPETAIAMVREVMANVEVPVTLKMRRGMDDSNSSRELFWEILGRAVDLGIVGVAVHGRTVVQRYEGYATWDVIGEVKSRYPHLVVFGSGDLYTVDDCFRMLHETQCDGVTIARGAIENPWIFRDCLARHQGKHIPSSPTLEEQAELFDKQLNYAVAQYGLERAMRQMRKFGIKRAKLHHDPEAVHRAFVHLGGLADWQRIRDELFLRPFALAGDKGSTE